MDTITLVDGLYLILVVSFLLSLIVALSRFINVEQSEADMLEEEALASAPQNSKYIT